MSGSKLFHSKTAFKLESGKSLKQIAIAYTSLGTRAADDSNVVWIFHALTANADPRDWWPDMLGAGKTFDPARDYIICANVLGSCYGSSGPLETPPGAQMPYYAEFPQLTIRDLVQAHQLLRAHLGINSIALGVGASLGGQQVLEWAVQEPHLFKSLILLATNAAHSPWGRAFNATQRMALEADDTLEERSENAGKLGLAAARAIAMLSYRSYAAYSSTQADCQQESRSTETTKLPTQFRADSYQRYQGKKLAQRFNAWSYYRLSEAMDSHDVGRGRGGITAALAGVTAPSLVIAISSDVLFPPAEQHLLAANIARARYVQIDSDFGHDGFLVEAEQLTSIITDFRCSAVSGRPGASGSVSAKDVQS